MHGVRWAQAHSQCMACGGHRRTANAWRAVGLGSLGDKLQVDLPRGWVTLAWTGMCGGGCGVVSQC